MDPFDAPIVTPHTSVEIAKSQKMRLFDVFILGPFMIAYAARSKRPPPVMRALLGMFGVTTIFYNARNYILTEAERQQ